MPLSAPRMNTYLTILFAALFYLAGACFIGVRLFGDRFSKQPPRALGIIAGFAGVLCHGLVLYQSVLIANGLNLGFFNVFSLAAWTVILLLMVSALTKPIENLGIILMPLAALILVLERFFPITHLVAESGPAGMRLHILISILAYGLLTLAAVQAILLAIQDRHLHNRHPGGFIRALPPLQTMEALLFEMIGLGFILLSLGLGFGIMFLEDMFAQHLVHKTLLSIASWIVFSILLWGRFRFGWRGRTAIRWTLVGFVVLVLAYFGSRAVQELILGG